MKRKTSLLTIVAVFACVCLALSACLPTAGGIGGGGKDKQLNAPVDIIFGEITKDAIAVEYVDYGEEGGVESQISIDGEVWIDFLDYDGYTFESLTPNTEYTIYARQKGYGNYKASQPFRKRVSTLKDVNSNKPKDVTASIYHGKVTLVGASEDMEISYDNGKTYVSDKSYTYTEKGKKTILVRYKATAGLLASDNLEIAVDYNDFAGGIGTQEDPFLIENYDEFMAIGPYSRSATYKLMADIVFPNTPLKDTILFSGTLLGNGKKLVRPSFDLTSNDGYNSYGGIFHTNVDAFIYDLTVEDAEIITNSKNRAHGILINKAKEISGCNVSGSITLACQKSQSYSVGGLCGELSDENSVIKNSSATISVRTTGEETSILNVGGLVGKISKDGCIVQNSNAKLVVSNEDTEVYFCNIGGIVGTVENNTSEIIISRCWADDFINVTANSRCCVGGIVSIATNTDIDNCYSVGSITAGTTGSDGMSLVAGISPGVANNDLVGSVVNCYSTVDMSVEGGFTATLSGIMGNGNGSYGSNKYKALKNCLFAGSATIVDTSKKYLYSISIVAKHTRSNNYVDVESAEGMEINIKDTAVDKSDYLTKAWFKDTLNFDEEIWNIVDGEFPTLK